MSAVIFKPELTEIAKIFNENFNAISKNDSTSIKEFRKKNLDLFLKAGFPDHSLERWKNTDLTETLAHSYNYHITPFEEKVDIDKIFQCEIHNFETFLFTQLNGWYIYNNQPVTELPNGVIVGSLAYAFKAFPELMEKHYGAYADGKNSSLIYLNAAFAQDGMFIYVPDNVKVDKPIQMVNIINIDENILVQPRNLIILGKNAHLTLVHCDDSIQHENSFINAVTEVFVDDNAGIDYYKLQNKDNDSTNLTHTIFEQKTGSKVNSNTITFNGGLNRNDTTANLKGEGAEANIYGLYLVDKQQHIDNQVSLNHIAPETKSFELFKGIVDDEASAVFNGYIHVAQDAQKTEAFQSNKNILLTDSGKINTKPFLEIYADDVKCSHGATVGQLDNEALFYIMSRGICERNAKMLLMYAFAVEIANKINIPVLRDRTEQMINKRLKGELSICDQCVLHCKENELINFDIDMSKV